jgi:hypothetical protein
MAVRATTVAEQGYGMMKSAIIVGLILLADTSIAAHGQDKPVHPGTALLDPVGISAGVAVPVCALVHPGTAILDSMGIYAGAPSLGSTVADSGCQLLHLPQHGD